MYLLAFETSFGQFSISLFKNNELVQHVASTEHNQQAERLIPEIEDLLRNNKITYKDLNYIAVGIGPGSFTGVRIGMAAAKGISLAAQIKLIGVSSLEAAALNQQGGKVYLDANRGEAFFQEFDNNLTPLTDACLIPYQGEFNPLPDSQSIGKAALKKLETASFELAPLYIRKPDAKFRIRKALDSDAEWVASLHANSFTSPWSLAVVKQSIRDEDTLIAGELGFASYRIIHEECELKTIAVLPEARRRGVAAFMMQTIINDCRKKGGKELFLEVEENNIPAVKLYESSGFRLISTRKDYYGQNRHALVMKYPILEQN